MLTLPTAFVGGAPGGFELLLVFLVVLLLFGAKNLPNMARTLGRTMEEFRKAARDVKNEIVREADDIADPEPSHDPKPLPGQVAWKRPGSEEEHTDAEPASDAAPGKGKEDVQS